MFKNLFGSKEEVSKDIELYSPMTGEYVNIEDIPDPVFAEKMMGEGFGVKPTEGVVVSPIKGKVVQVFPTKHAIGLKADNDIEVLIHIGLETVQLEGEGFETLIAEGDTVDVGDELVQFDIDYISQKAESLISPVIITNTDQLDTYTSNDVKQVEKGQTVIFNLTAK
ncbi:PTS glucose transporter subunit IIA [Abyssicoccus albus]|uniref:PTS system IIA component (Glc family) n=1 Tax=Abyssicoccus albus TaxID=1817405 RepID=A0A1Q1G1H0_9BACL|nr:PTS glucose transporter subunit IIA [Abyssicoccus albus]AQL56198.1 PTS glucose transporter subunit IIA [Abyssicoccus albus]RPF57985.1 PTS system IIA component (Glc family) [Abyssicoccus albus]